MNCVDIFSGCGGLTLGLHKAGIQGLFSIEKSVDAFETMLEMCRKAFLNDKGLPLKGVFVCAAIWYNSFVPFGRMGHDSQEQRGAPFCLQTRGR